MTSGDLRWPLAGSLIRVPTYVIMKFRTDTPLRFWVIVEKSPFHPWSEPHGNYVVPRSVPSSLFYFITHVSRRPVRCPRWWSSHSVLQVMPYGGSDNNIYCDVCDVYVTSAICMPIHERGRQHKQKTKNKIPKRPKQKCTPINLPPLCPYSQSRVKGGGKSWE